MQNVQVPAWPRNNTFLKRYCEIGAPNVFIWLVSVKENWKRKALAHGLLVVCGTRDPDESHNR